MPVNAANYVDGIRQQIALQANKRLSLGMLTFLTDLADT